MGAESYFSNIFKHVNYNLMLQYTETIQVTIFK